MRRIRPTNQRGVSGQNMTIGTLGGVVLGHTMSNLCCGPEYSVVSLLELLLAIQDGSVDGFSLVSESSATHSAASTFTEGRDRFNRVRNAREDTTRSWVLLFLLQSRKGCQKRQRQKRELRERQGQVKRDNTLLHLEPDRPPGPRLSLSWERHGTI